MFKLAEKEKEILKFWQENDIFAKTLAKESPKGDYVFYDGPPFATGTPHYGHILASIMKDIVPRYWTMKGYHVERVWGWDTHGLPIENIVEEEIGSKSKKDIEEYGVEKFNEACRSKVLMYAEEWQKVVERLGRWVDMENAYKTMDKDYMESIWWVFKELWQKDLVYKNYKSMHVCPRCETTLSQSEVTEGYEDVKDVSVTVKFELLDEPNTYVLAWTTTPWTLPGNVALAVGEEIDYIKLEYKGKKYILAKSTLEESLVDMDYKILEEFTGDKLVGKKYKPLFDYYLNTDMENKDKLYVVEGADFVSTEDGTGVVHIAPAFGEDDMNLGKEKSLPFIQHVAKDGRIKPEVKDFAGLEVKPKDDPQTTDKKIIEFLKDSESLFKSYEYEHSYPHCWRCHSPLINYATESWFVNVEKIKPKALESAKNINWVPSHIKEGRFGKWLEGARDWSISRQRYWGSVMPIWICDKCEEKKVVGSIKELEELSGEKVEDLHKHTVDKITFKCECGGEMHRIPDVLDCWFESGSMPYAQMHYPFENKEKFEKNFPAEFIAEGVDQTRAWFYYMHILGNAIKDREAYKNVIVNGIVLAEDGKKMSKHLQNYPDPLILMDKMGTDKLRYYLTASQAMKADNLNFSEKDLDEQTRFFNTLLNVVNFYLMFAGDGEKSGEVGELDNVLDRWIVARLEQAKQKITQKLNAYDLHAIREIPVFVDDLSTWYVRRSRERLKTGSAEEKEKCLSVLKYTLLELAKLMAPFMPFLAEHIYREVGGQRESVHLENWPENKNEKIEQKLIDYMQITRKVVELGLKERADVSIKVRQPLKSLKIKNYELEGEYLDLIKEEVNVKKIEQEKGVGDPVNLEVILDTEMTDELKKEGLFRELVRKINSLRKKEGLTIEDRVVVKYNSDDGEIKEVFKVFKNDFKDLTLAESLLESDEDLEKHSINEYSVGIGIEKPS